jgi:putative effector of murein hydrolase
MVVTTSMVRLLQLILGSSKPASRKKRETSPNAFSTAAVITRSNDVVIRGPDNGQLTLPFSDQSVQRPPSIALLHMDVEMSYSVLALQPLRRDTHSQELGPFSRSERWAALLDKNLDRITYLILFLLVGLPVYYATGYAAPAQLTFSVLAYFIAISIPEGWKRVLHPVLVSSAIIILGLWVLGLPLSSNLHSTLSHYKTNAKYLQIWSGSKKLPGAGDIFASILDASIVALALPMFHYRKELYKHFIFILIPNVAISAASLFGYPAVCYAIGISSSRSISFAVRSLTLALATPAATSLGGDLNTAASLAIASGIFGVLIGEYLFRLLRISQEDFVTRGVTVGGTSSAIGTAMLLTKDPRAAALSSLSMGLFGTVTVLLTSIPPTVKLVQSLVHEEA